MTFIATAPHLEPIGFEDMDELAEFFLDDSRRLLTNEPPVFYGVEGAKIRVHTPDLKARVMNAEEYATLTHTVAVKAIETPLFEKGLLANTKLTKAMAHPLRADILRKFRAGATASPRELADEFEAPLGNVSYHVRTLKDLGFIKCVKKVPRRGAIEHYYEWKGSR